MQTIDRRHAPDPRHPIVRAALARHGATPEDILSHPEWGSDMTIWHNRGNAGDRPSVASAKDCIRVHMPCADGREVAFYQYENLETGRDTFWRHDLELKGMHVPDTVMASMAGRVLDEIVKVPGGSGLHVIEAHDAPTGCILRLKPPEETDHG